MTEMPSADSDFDVVEIYRARNLPEAHAIRLMMEREGIVVAISNEALQGIVGEVAMGWSTSPRLTVRRLDASRARSLMNDFTSHAADRDRSLDEGSLKCLACGAAMNAGSVCLACGWTYGDDDDDLTSEMSDRNSDSIVPAIVADPIDRAHDTTSAEEILPVLRDRPVLPVPAVWWEVAAVLCVGFVTYFASSIFYFVHPAATGPYWAIAVEAMVSSFATTFVTLYIIHRSGERWREFGISALRFTDVVLAMLLAVLMRYFGSVLQSGFSGSHTSDSNYVAPVTTIDFVLMSFMYAISALSEEVVMRAYLITRLRQLLRRPWLAVVISAILFALYHGYLGAFGTANALFVGVVFGSVFCIYPRIWPLVICHTLVNMWLEFAAMK